MLGMVKQLPLRKLRYQTNTTADFRRAQKLGFGYAHAETPETREFGDTPEVISEVSLNLLVKLPGN